ncbi:YdeI/OmpD-associated family protein [Martelella soudanensis]|uniref:YdeI/OmpD-associated family protein n=1 Tax=unclassified Martelella TaxID=2629616 RepID=UPI0015DDAB7C|nr:MULTISPECIES: hypothetical protein [unclassified Martelella]
MATFEVDMSKVLEFTDPGGFYSWLESHHDIEVSVWVKIHKVKSRLPTVTPEQAIEMALCWGWIDGLRKGFDDCSFLQRYSRRRPNSNWSEINARTVRRLIASGHMRPAGLAAVRRGVERGKWPANVPAISLNSLLATA